MKKKSFFGKYYYIGGTILLAVLTIIVSVNFVRDSRLFEKPMVAVSKDKTVKPVETSEPKTIKVSDDDGDKGSGKSTGNAEKEEKLMVEVVNRTGNPKIGENVKSSLEAKGFVVVLKNDGIIQDETVIIERTEKKAGEKVQAILKAGRLLVEIQKEPYFDAIIEIGTDYAP